MKRHFKNAWPAPMVLSVRLAVARNSEVLGPNLGWAGYSIYTATTWSKVWHCCSVVTVHYKETLVRIGHSPDFRFLSLYCHDVEKNCHSLFKNL